MSAQTLSGWRFVLFNLCMGLSHALVICNAGAYIAMLPHVAAGLGIPPSFATWTQTDYMIALALSLPVAGWLGRRFGEYWPFVVAMLAFAAASWACAACERLPTYLLSRILLGFAGGVSLPLGQALLMKAYPLERKSLGIGVWSLFTLTPFTLGPLLGGWLADTFGWRSLFLFNLPLALIFAALVLLLAEADLPRQYRQRFDLLGFLGLVVLAFGGQTLLNQGNDWDWLHAAGLSICLAVLIAVLGYWIVWELGTRRPCVQLRLFAQRNFTLGVLILSLGFLFFQGLSSLLIVQLQLQLGYSSFLAGWVFLPMAVFAKPLASVCHQVVKHLDARWLASLNLLGFAVTYFWLSRFDTADAFAQLFWPKLLEGACLGSFFAPLTAILLQGLPVDQQPKALELASLLRIAAGAVGITIQGVVLYRRTPLHMTHFAEQFSPLDASASEALQTLLSHGWSSDTALAMLAKLAARNAAIQAINDAFWLAGWVFVGLAALVWCTRATRPPVNASPAAQIKQDAQTVAAEEV